MRCCVPFCKNTSDNVSPTEAEGKEISFHVFPREVHLRAAWLRALGKKDNLPDSAVVCSQHFLSDDIYETESGSKKIRMGAIPSTVQVCMICLDTDSKLLLMSKHKLEEAYEKLTGQPLCDQGNLKQTLCIQCAQRLTNFSRFRDMSLRAHALMMDLVEKHELITRRTIKMINHTKHQLKSNMVLTTLGPDHCDLHILEHLSEDKQTELEETGHQVLVKTETDDSTSVDEDTEVINEEDNNGHWTLDIVKNEFITSNDENISDYSIIYIKHVYMRRMSVMLEDGNGDGECETSQVCKPHTAVSPGSAHSALSTEIKQADPRPSAHSALTIVAPLPASLSKNNEMKVSPTEEADTHVSCQYKGLTDCVVKLYDVFSKTVVPRPDETLKEIRIPRSCVSQNIASKDISYPATSQNKLPTTESLEPVISTLKASQSKTDCLKNVIKIQCNNLLQNITHIGERWFICDICRKMYKRKSFLVNHIKTHTEVRQFTCKICQYKCKYQSLLKRHMRTHTGEKPFTCKLCNHKCAQNDALVMHMRIHTGERPFSCKLCNYKCTKNSDLVRHMRTHTGEKPFTCKLCNHKCAQNGALVIHMRMHTGERPFSCKLCNYKCIQNGDLVRHMRTHTGEKPFSCKLCNYKCTTNRDLVRHFRIHTGERPFFCNLCDYKCAENGDLVRHMRTHTGEKPYFCKICEYKCACRSNLKRHMRTHTAAGETPSSSS
ncbi:myoneurin-like [Maniola jurtina]|uniref:myoneurin-like n=1 Tax=Maniola jurtina TaxID=191418 RepID=UPI001E6880E3|nr:myoneurin-like [Maniola jurtina]